MDDAAVLAWKIFLSLIGLVLGAIGLAGLPDDAKRWQEWLAVMIQKVDQNKARWILVLVAAGLLVLAWLPWSRWFGSSVVVGSTNGNTSAALDAAVGTLNPRDAAAMKESLQSTKAKVSELQLVVDSLTRERDEAVKALRIAQNDFGNREQLINQIRSSGEARYISAIKEAEKQVGKSPAWKSQFVAVDLCERLMAQRVNGQEDFENFKLQMNQHEEVIQVMSSYFESPISIEGDLPPNWQMKQFSAFNTEHNALLNKLDFHIVRLKGEMEVLPGSN